MLYIAEGILRKPGFRDIRILYFLQESLDARELLTPINDNATVYRGSGKKDMIGVVVSE